MKNKEEAEVYTEKWMQSLKMWRQEHNISLSKMSELLDVDSSLLAKYESNERSMKVSFFIRYLAHLDMHVIPKTGLQEFLVNCEKLNL